MPLSDSPKRRSAKGVRLQNRFLFGFYLGDAKQHASCRCRQVLPGYIVPGTLPCQPKKSPANRALGLDTRTQGAPKNPASVAKFLLAGKFPG